MSTTHKSKPIKKASSKRSKPVSFGKSNSTEKWKDIPKTEKYEISSNGRIRNKQTKNIRKQNLKNGYYYFNIYDESIEKIVAHRVHRIVAKLFVKNPDKKKYDVVNHIDGNKLNNNYKNLEWTNAAGNNDHAAKNKLTGVTKRKISQYVCEYFIAEYESLTEASIATGIHMSRIVEVCKGQREEYDGYIFKYTDVNPNEKEVDLEEEGFKQIKTFPNYWINNKGQIYSKPFKKFMKTNKHKNGVIQIQLTKKDTEAGKGQIKKTVLIHNLVAMYFMRKPKKNENYIKHKDGNKENNNVDNLEWGYLAGIQPNFDI